MFSLFLFKFSWYLGWSGMSLGLGSKAHDKIKRLHYQANT